MRLGVDLGGTKIEIIALDDDGTTLVRERVLTPAGDYDATIRAIGDLVRGVEARLGRSGTVGVATPGALSAKTGLIKNSNSVVLNGKPLDRDLAAHLGRPIRMEKGCQLPGAVGSGRRRDGGRARRVRRHPRHRRRRRARR